MAGNDSETPNRRKVVILGATGSIGGSALRIAREHGERIEIVGVASRDNYRDLAAICREFEVPAAAVTNPESARAARAEGAFPSTTTLLEGESGLCELATAAAADLVLVAVVGAAGLAPALAAIEAGKDLAIANKELLVLGGSFVIEAAKRKGVRLLPADSEHNAIFQCLDGRPGDPVDRLILTASGGAFRGLPVDALADVTPAQATRHPNWSMGPKVTVDSATMANKGLELIEAHWLFGLPHDRIDVVIHPQSIVHSCVQFVDGSVLAQMSPPSMTFAIQHCLLYPERVGGVDPALDFHRAFTLDFEPPDLGRHPCLKLAYQALEAGGAAPAAFNAANEIAVERFLGGDLAFLDIPKVIGYVLDQSAHHPASDLDGLMEADREARARALEFQSGSTH